MTYLEAKSTIEAFFDTILNELWLTTEQRKGLAEALDLACDALKDKGYSAGYQEGYVKGFADGYERALKNTPTFPIIPTSPAHIVPDQLQGWRYEENDN